jgi:hypothetical protein
LTSGASGPSIVPIEMEDPLTLTQDRRTELLAACRLFSGVASPDLAAVADRAVEVDFPDNHVIARQGEIGTGFFLIVSGSVRVIRGGEEVAVLGPGEFFDALPRPRQLGFRAGPARQPDARALDPPWPRHAPSVGDGAAESLTSSPPPSRAPSPSGP